MPDQDPLEKLLDQIAIALNTIYFNKDNALKGQVSPTVTQQIQQLEEFSNILEKSYWQTVEKSSKKVADEAILNPDPKTAETIEKTQAMLKLIAGLRRDIVNRQKELAPKPLSGEDKLGIGKKRKKTAAKNIGYKGWQKL